MSDQINLEELIDRLLLIATLNSTLMHFLLSAQVEGYVDPDRVDSLTQGLIKTRTWMEEATTISGLSSSTANIMGLIVKRLSQIESILPKLSQKAKEAEAKGTPTQEILSLLDGGKAKVTTGVPTTSTTTVTEDSEAVGLVSAEPEPPPEPYRKVGVENDEWGLIGQTDRLIQQYSKRCQILLPTFWLQVMKEIHKYHSQSPYIGDVIEIPGKVIARIVKGLLTEAPGARLLQDLMKARPQEKYLESTEMERIERAVSKYYQGLELVLQGNIPNPQEKINEAKAAFDGFGWGGPELEKRLIKRINQRCEEALNNAESATDPARAIIYAEVAKLLSKLQHAILAEPRLREILAQMKP